MRLDKYSNPIFNEHDLFDAIYRGYQINPNDVVFVEDRDSNIVHFEDAVGVRLFSPINSPTLTQAELDTARQETWYMPEEYKTLDIENWLLCQATDIVRYNRVQEELEEFKARNMLDLLRWLKYFVDVCSKENIVWGVGRGSSVASYVLYIIGVHNIDPIKYNLDWREFLR